MAFFLTFLGITLLVAGYQNTVETLGGLLKGDLTGKNNFFYWLLAIFCIGIIGYVPRWQKFSDTFIALVIIAMLLHNGGFFTNFMSALQGGTAKNVESNNHANPQDLTLNTGSSGGSSGKSSGGLGGLLGDFSPIASIAGLA